MVKHSDVAMDFDSSHKCLIYNHTAVKPSVQEPFSHESTCVQVYRFIYMESHNNIYLLHGHICAYNTKLTHRHFIHD